MLTYKQFLRNELSDAKREIKNLEDALEKRESRLTYIEKESQIDTCKINNLRDTIKDFYYVLKTIKGISKDSSIQVLCTLKMEDIKRIPCVYSHEDEDEEE